jgi:hypothetical protein
MDAKKMTAVEWLALYIKGITNLNCDEVIDQAKAMEKDQIEKAYNESWRLRDKPYLTALKYYNETYGK